MTTKENQPHPYETAVKKLVNAIETDRFLTISSINELRGVTDKSCPRQSIQAQITVEIELPTDLDNKPLY